MNRVRTKNQKKCYGKMRFCSAGILLVVAFVYQSLSPAHAAQSCEQWAGRAFSIEGKVEVSHAGQTNWNPISNQDLLCPGDRLRVDRRSRAAILLPNKTLLRLAGGSALTFMEADNEERSWLDLLRGVVHFISRTPRSLNIRTPFVNAGIEGTEFALRVGPTQTRIWVFEGQVAATSKQGSLMLASGEAGVAEKGSAPVRKLVARPRDAVQWALYYPPVIDYREETYSAGPDAPALREALALYRKGNLPAAFARLDALPTGSRSAQYHDLRAGLLLSVGQVEEARADIEQALGLDPKDGIAYALQSVIAVTQNENEKALALALKGAELSPQSPVPQVALSYAHQAQFDIEKAKQSVEQAVNIAPQDALAWARLAELELSLGYLDRATAAARKAVEHDPNLARTQTVLGFANLTEIEIDEAQSAFESAIGFDPSDPLPRLGLGLAKIRQGDLDEGTEQIETAAILDPDNALVRSYLGKAYYEQKRTQLARTELAIAKELDPKDPTPWFYDAILKQTENRPVEALHDLQGSIDLNDNRAIYRSRFLLDKDEAARSVSLARIYDGLGIEQPAVVEASKSLASDPANHSAHRFLSDTYVRFPKHGISQVSELLQAQLLQPLNINPIQPRRSVKGEVTVFRFGSSEATFNEFSPLFEQDQKNLTISGLGGNNETYGNEVVLSGLESRFSYSLGQYHYETEGFREGADLRHDIFSMFVQAAIANDLSAQVEYRQRDTDQGDRRLSLQPITVPDKRDLFQKFTRIGLHWSPSLKGDLLGSFIYTDRREIALEEDAGSSVVTVADERKGYVIEGQYIHNSDNINLVLGGGLYRIDGIKETTTTTFPFEETITVPSFFGPITTTLVNEGGKSSDFDDIDVESGNLYVYANFHAPQSVVWTLGLSYDKYSQVDFDAEESQFNPKIGVQWQVSDNVDIRTAYGKVLKRQLAVDQTIEPTQLAGFNQFFDDFNGTKSEYYGLGIDNKFFDKLFLGGEVTRRNLTRLGDDREIRESRYTIYLNYLPHKNWSVSSQYSFLNDDIPNSFDLDTKIATMAVRYFSPQRHFQELQVTYAQQDQARDSSPTIEEDVAIVDLIVGFRLPKRRGIISLEVKNLFNQKFQWQDAWFKTADKFNVVQGFFPDRAIMGNLVLDF